MNKEISKLLKRMGFSAAHSGYRYCREAIRLTIKNPKLVRQLKNELYPLIGSEFEVSADTVERCIRSAVEAAWLRGDYQFHEALFQYSISALKGKPTNQEFLSVITEYFLLKEADEIRSKKFR